MTSESPRIVRRLPEALPRGESILWQGAPQTRPLAIHVFHIRKLAIYFGAILAWRAATAFGSDQSVGVALVSILWVLPLVVAVLGLAWLTAYLVRRTTTYTITTGRIAMQYGIAFPMTLNIPLRKIESASMKRYADGSGEIPVVIAKPDRIAYYALWPHARPWRIARPEPMLRGLVEPERIAAILTDALRKVADAPPAAPSGQVQPGAAPSAQMAAHASAAA